MVIGGMVKGAILGHPGATHAVEERRLGVGVGRAMFSERKTNRPICYPAGWLIPEKSAEFSESIC
eukprot:COSAG01_NODE_4161_length_5283_cov_38.647184_2_plen_65_part_00